MSGGSALLEDRTVIYSGGIAFDVEPVIRLYNMTVLTESGYIFELSENNIVMQIPNPEDVLQMHADDDLLMCIILYKNRELVVHARNSLVSNWIITRTIPDVDCLSG